MRSLRNSGLIFRNLSTLQGGEGGVRGDYGGGDVN